MTCVPTEGDWGADWRSDVDCAAAHERFAGTSREEAARRFGHGDIIERIDELRFMPTIPFRFYVLSLCDYLRSPHVLESADPAAAGSGFLNLIAEKAEHAPDEIRPVLASVMVTAEYVASHQRRFRARSAIFGSFGAKIRKLRRLALPNRTP